MRANGLGVVVTDYDSDGWPDVFVANDTMPNFLFRNTGNLRFGETGLVSGIAAAPTARHAPGWASTRAITMGTAGSTS